MVVRIFFSFIVVLLFSGCVGGKKELVVEIQKYPKWYTSLHQDSSAYYYGFGEGLSKQEAVAMALNDTASKLSIIVESTHTTHTNIQTKNGHENYTQNIDKKIKNEVKKIEFNSYEILKYEKINQTYFVEVAIDRVKNAQLKTQKIKSKIDSYNQALLSMDANIITKLKKLNKISNEINAQTLRDCDVVKTLNYSDKIDSYIKTLKEIDAKIAEYKNRTTFAINADDGYKNAVIEQISSKGYTVLNDGAKIKLHIYVLETQLYVMGNYIYKANIEITASESNKVVGKKILTVGAKSRSSYEMAKEFGVSKFRDKLKKEGVLFELVGV